MTDAAAAPGAHTQASYVVRLEWGPTGASAVTGSGTACDVAVVVDVLSFTTTLCVAVERGVTVFPFPWRDAGAPAYAAARHAVLAVGRAQPGVSLSPARAPGVRRRGRRRRTGGGAVARRLPAPGGGGSVGRGRDPRGAAGRGARRRPVARGPRRGRGYDAVRRSLADDLLACASGRELAGRGFADDVRLAAEVDASEVVPVLAGEAFVDVRSHTERPGSDLRHGLILCAVLAV